MLQTFRMAKGASGLMRQRLARSCGQRGLHRCYTTLVAEEQKKDGPESIAVEKDLKGKQVKLGGQVAAYSYRGELCWTATAESRYGTEVCHMVKAWVESE